MSYFIKTLKFIHLNKIVILFINAFSILFFFALADLLNLDNLIYTLLNRAIGITQSGYYDVPFLSILEITGLFAAACVPFFILREEQEVSRKRAILEHKPFLTSSQIRFEPFSHTLRFGLTNIGAGSALFIRVSFEEKYKDIRTQIVLRKNEPYSRDIAPLESSDFFFDPQIFARFITKSKRGAELTANEMNIYHTPERTELYRLYNSKVNQIYFIYVHCQDILNNPISFKITFLLELENPIYEDYPKFLLKRMRVEEIMRI